MSDKQLVYRTLGAEWLGEQMIRIYRSCLAAGNTKYGFVASAVCGDHELQQAIKHNTSHFQIMTHEVVLMGVLEIIEGVTEHV